MTPAQQQHHIQLLQQQQQQQQLQRLASLPPTSQSGQHTQLLQQQLQQQQFQQQQIQTTSAPNVLGQQQLVRTIGQGVVSCFSPRE